ncbi:MAG: DUF4388 domain-containing protein [Candidatus Obscuribacterales bacterium]
MTGPSRLQQPGENPGIDTAVSDAASERTIPLADGKVQESVLVLIFGPDLLDELEGVAHSKKSFETIVVDCRKSGFVFPAETLLEAASAAMRVLEVHGVITFVKSDKVVVVVKSSLLGDMMLHSFDAMADVYGFSPSVAFHILKATGSVGSESETTSDLTEQIWMSTVPVLTPFGIKLKVGMEAGKRRNILLAAIDNYTPLSLILKRLEGQLNREELTEDLRDLEVSGAIFPINAKIPFLVHCFRNKIPFKLLTYLVEARLISQSQLDEILFLAQNTKGGERLSVGAQCVAKGFISARQLEIALQDQAFYGQRSESEKTKSMEPEQQDVVQSLVGHLGTTDPSGILQSLSNNRETGVLSVEHKDMQFRALLEGGKVSNAKLGKLRGNDAILEFASTWKDGVFVFIDRQPPPDLVEDACRTTKLLDKLLLDSALARDNMAVVVKKLPRGLDTALEKLDDTLKLLDGATPLTDPQDKMALTAGDIELMQRVWKELDGLASVSAVIKRLANITTLSAATAINRLLHFGLCQIPSSDLHAPMRKFQDIAAAVAEQLGKERVEVLLRLSLQSSAGYSVRARMFNIGTAGEIGVDLSAAKQAGTSLSAVTRELEDWQVRFIEYVSQELDKDVLRNIVYRVHQRQ